MKMDHYLMRFFAYDHLPQHLQPISKAFAEVARYVLDNCHECPQQQERALEKLIEAKDCAVRAAVKP